MEVAGPLSFHAINPQLGPLRKTIIEKYAGDLEVKLTRINF